MGIYSNIIDNVQKKRNQKLFCYFLLNREKNGCISFNNFEFTYPSFYLLQVSKSMWKNKIHCHPLLNLNIEVWCECVGYVC